MNPAISTSLIHDMVSSGVLARTSGSVLTLQHVVCVREFSGMQFRETIPRSLHRTFFLMIKNYSSTMERIPPNIKIPAKS